MNTIGSMHVPWDRNAGIHLCTTGPIDTSEYDFDGYTVVEERKYTWDVNQKANAMPGVMRMSRELIEKLLEALYEGAPRYSPDWFPLMVAKLGNKVEILGPEADRDKNRVFFIGCLLKMVLQKLHFSAPFRQMFGKDFCGVGHCWGAAGACRVARQLKFRDANLKTRFWFQGDFKALDQSMKAGMLCLISMMMALTIKPGEQPSDTLMWRVALAVIACLSIDTAVTLIKWFGKEWRYVIGVLFSGEFVTSMFDTIYVYIALMVVHYSFLDDLKNRKNYEKIKKKILKAITRFALIYGDDTTWSLPARVVRLIESIPSVGKGGYMDAVIKRLRDQFDMMMKPKGSSDTDQFSTPYSSCTPDGILLQENGKYGLKFLRRHFVKSEFVVSAVGSTDPKSIKTIEVVQSMRKISDAWSKATNTHHDADTYTQWFARVKSFLFENMGVSLATDRFLRMFIASIRTNMDYLEAKEDEDYILLRDKFGYSKVSDEKGRTVKFDAGDRDLIEKYKRVAPWMTEEEIFNKDVPPRDWLLTQLALKVDDSEFAAIHWNGISLREGVFKCDGDELKW